MNSPRAALSPLQKSVIAIVLLFCGALVFILGTNYYSIFPTNDSQLYRGVLAALFLGAALLLRRKVALEPYSQIAYAFFIAALAYLLTSATAEFRDSLLRGLSIPLDTSRGLTCIKLFEATLVIGLILILTRFWGGDLGSIYIKRGRLGVGIFVGLSLMTMNTATGFATGATLGQPVEELAARLPWALLFSLANGLMEELLFRGILIRRMTTVIGATGAIIVTAVVFTVMHSAASYMNPAEVVVFQVILLPMALLLGFLVHKTDNIWGATLFHAGSDVFLFYLMGW